MSAAGLQQSRDDADRPVDSTSTASQVNTLVDVYSKHQRRIYRYCLALLRNPDDAEDATQETFTRAAPFLPNLAGDLSAYLTTVARNICCDVVRARAKRPVPLDNVSLADRAVSPERQSIDWDVVRRMWRQLSPSERLLFAYTFAGYRYEEIAIRTGMSRPSVSVGLTRARRRLRDLATAIGALGALPLGLRRLFDRAARRANAAASSGQQVLVAVAEQAGSIAAGLLAGIVAAGSAGAATVAMPAALATAQHGAQPALPAAAAAAAAVDRSVAASGGVAVRQQPARPAPMAAVPPPFVVSQAAAVLPGGQATPDDTEPSAVTPSPDFLDDGIAFFTADDVHACPGGNGCPTLYQTSDGGASWTRIWSSTYRGGQVLLSPRFPADPTIFVVDPHAGLESGTTSDAAPSVVVPGAVIAAIAPDSPVGLARIAAATQAGTLLGYTAGDRAPTTGPSLPTGITPNALVFTGGDQVLVAGFETGGPPLVGTQQAVLVRCTLSSSCAAPLPVPSEIALALAAGAAAGGPVVAYSMHNAYLSTDGGATIRQIAAAPAGRLLESAAVGSGPSGARILLSHSDLATQRLIWMSYSDDLGAGFTDATGNLVGTGPAQVTRVLGNGSLLVGVMTDSTHFAMDASPGNGVWTAAHPS